MHTGKEQAWSQHTMYMHACTHKHFEEKTLMYMIVYLNNTTTMYWVYTNIQHLLRPSWSASLINKCQGYTSTLYVKCLRVILVYEGVLQCKIPLYPIWIIHYASNRAVSQNTILTI